MTDCTLSIPGAYRYYNFILLGLTLNIEAVKRCVIIIYNLSGEKEWQLTIEDFFKDTRNQRDCELKRILDTLQERYQLDFAGHLNQIYQMDTLHKTVEYMRKHM